MDMSYLPSCWEAKLAPLPPAPAHPRRRWSWSLLSIVSTAPSSLQSLVPQRQCCQPTGSPLMQWDGVTLPGFAWTNLRPEEGKISLGFTVLCCFLEYSQHCCLEKPKKRQKSTWECERRGVVGERGMLLCSAKNMTVRSPLSMPYSLRHRERRCPDAFVLYILYIFIYIRYTCKLGWCFLLNKIKSIENVWDVCAASSFLQPCMELLATASLTPLSELFPVASSRLLMRNLQVALGRAMLLCRFSPWAFAAS